MRKPIRKLWNLWKFSPDEIMMMKHVRAARIFRRDLRNVTPEITCRCCGGHATELKRDRDTGVLMCKDRATCRKTMQFTSMIGRW